MRSIRVLTTMLLVGLACSATVGAAEETPTFTKDVAPILFTNCVVCHRAGSRREHAGRSFPDEALAKGGDFP